MATSLRLKEAFMQYKHSIQTSIYTKMVLHENDEHHFVSLLKHIRHDVELTCGGTSLLLSCTSYGLWQNCMSVRKTQCILGVNTPPPPPPPPRINNQSGEDIETAISALLVRFLYDLPKKDDQNRPWSCTEKSASECCCQDKCLF